MPDAPYYYDPKRTAYAGRWVAVSQTTNAVQLTTYQTEREVREAFGLEGGSTDPRYRPESVR